MADAQDSSTKGGLTRGKAILIAILGIVLVVILYMQFGQHGEAATRGPAAYRPPRRPGARPAAAQGPTAASTLLTTEPGAKESAPAPVIDEKRWKPPELVKVIAYDPFKLPEAFPQPSRAAATGATSKKNDLAAALEAENAKRRAEALSKLHTQLKELKHRGASLILRDRDQYVAMIDDRILHVGDQIDGFTVIAIDDQNGVVIERKDSP